MKWYENAIIILVFWTIYSSFSLIIWYETGKHPFDLVFLFMLGIGLVVMYFFGIFFLLLKTKKERKKMVDEEKNGEEIQEEEAEEASPNDIIFGKKEPEDLEYDLD